VRSAALIVAFAIAHIIARLRSCNPSSRSDTVKQTILVTRDQSSSDGSSGVAIVTMASPLSGTVRKIVELNLASCSRSLDDDLAETRSDSFALGFDAVFY
jgi:hypothetical protein